MGATKIRGILFASLALLGLSIVAPCAFAQENLLIWDGETTTTYSYGSANTTQAFRGGTCFEAVPDAYHSPGIKLGGLSSYRKDISGYDEIWMFVKTDQPTKGVTFGFNIYGSQNTSNSVDAASHADGGKIDGTYRLVRIPISELKTTACPLTSIDVLYFGTAKPSAGHKLYIDEIWAVKLSSIDVTSAPFLTGHAPMAFGDVGVLTEQTKNMTISNVGNGPLVVSSVTVSGAQSGEFRVSPANFTLAPGQTQSVSVVFNPHTPADVSATLVMAHSKTITGSTTSVALTGRGVSSLLVLPSDSLDFGSAPANRKISWPFFFQNNGNQNLVVSNFVAPAKFAVTPESVTVAPGQIGQASVSFTAGDQTDVITDEKLSFAANDPNHPQTEVLLSAKALGGAEGSATKLTLRTPKITSSSVTLAWPHYDDATGVKVYLAPEPAGTRNEPLYETLVSEQPSDSTGCVIEKLAANVDVFFRVVVSSETKAPTEGYIHVRTAGGPAVPLDTAVREVHLMGPKIMQVILMNMKVTSYTGETGTLVGSTGPEWQSGDWTITRLDGTKINVTGKYRNTVPAGQNYFPLGYGKDTHDELQDVEHRIYLMLDAAVGNRDILHIQGPLGVDFLLPYSDHYLETPAIQVNQVGYSPRSTERWAYFSGWLGDGGPLVMSDYPATCNVIYDYDDFSTDVKVRGNLVSDTVAITQRSAADTGAGGEVRQASLSSVPQGEGVMFRVCLPGVGVSWPTQVSETAIFKAFFTVARGLYHNRWGCALEEKYTEWAPRKADHTTVYDPASPAEEVTDFALKFPETRSTAKELERTLIGGHHDAGDYDQRPFHYMVSMFIMRAYEANIAAFTDGQLIIPESGNGIPDLLDEALWSLQGWLCLQEADGGIRQGAESFRHPWGMYFADEDPIPYWTYSRNAIHTARMGGLFAQGARLMKPFVNLNDTADPKTVLFNKLSDGAQRAYTYALNNGISESTNGALLLLSGELYRLTGDATYKAKFESTWFANKVSFDPRGPNIFEGYPWVSSLFAASQPALGDHVMGYLTGPDAITASVDFARKTFVSAADKTLAIIQSDSAHRNGRPAAAYIEWGQSTAVGRWLFPMYHAIQLGGISDEKKQQYFNAISVSGDYALGCNPNGMSWITELGSRHPEDPDHHDSLAFKMTGKGLIPGIPVYGPSPGVPAPTSYQYMANIFYPTFDQHPLLRRYSDTHYFIVNNEFTVEETQAPQTQLFAMLIAPGMMPPASWYPFQPEHRNTLAPRKDEKTPPTTGTLSAPAFAKSSPITVSYSGVSATESGLKAVKLWFKDSTSGTWQEFSQSLTSDSGSFDFVPPTENVTYSFDLRVEDNAGKLSEVPSGNGQASTIYDTIAPEPGTLTASPYSKTAPLMIKYNGAKDNLSGLAEVRLWVKKGKSGTWTDTAQTASTESGTFEYAPTGEDQYFFFLQAKDKAGNSSAAPTDTLVFGGV